MERFSEFNKNKDNKSPETEIKIEELEMEETQVKEKKFLNRIKESARYFFHIAPRENFKKALRVVALVTVLSVPVGEKAFAEREINAKEQTVAIAIEQENKENKEEREDYKEFIESEKKYFESFSDIAEQKRLLKEKYKNVHIIDIPKIWTFEEQKILQKEYGLDSYVFGGVYESEYSVEELKDFDEALEKVQKFAPKQFRELKIVLKRVENNILFSMMAEPNLCKELDNQILNIKFNENNMFLLFNYLSMQRSLVEMQKITQKIKNSDNSVNSYYDVIFSTDREIMVELNSEILEENKTDINTRETGHVSNIDDIKQKNIYKNSFIHELCHLITLNNPDAYKELVDKFDKINKKVDGGKIITHPIPSIVNLNIIRYPGFVSAYAGAKNTDVMKSGYSDKYDNKNTSINEGTAETMTYMINDHHYADDDPIVQEKIIAIKEFLNKKNE